jgi:uncharacterized RmlC-like cupin family protein
MVSASLPFAMMMVTAPIHREVLLVSDNSVRVVRQHERFAGASTAGMIREEAVATDGLWAGLVRTEPHMASGWHHHDDYETAIYVVAGQLRMEFGPGGRDALEARSGDFVHVPNRVIHRESNPLDDEATLIVVRAGTGEPVVNVDGPEPDH